VTTATTTLRLGTRRSALALVQSTRVAEALRSAGLTVDLVEVETEGDRSTEAVTQLGNTGVFVTEIRHRLLTGEVDIAVHSLKDLPTAAPDGITLAAVPGREDPRDALITRDGRMLAELSPGTTIGTGSPRRAAQLRALGLDLDVVPIRGNVDTRLAKVSAGEVDGVVLAAAGLRRLGRIDEASEVIDPGQMLPAPGQGALAIECRAEAGQLAEQLRALLDNEESRAAVTSERALLARLEAGCTAPVGALADVAIDEDESGEIYLRAVVAGIDGARAIRLSMTGSLTEAEGIGRRLAEDLLDAGAADLIGVSA
jgi:hydroxymethylbilane synthase